MFYWTHKILVLVCFDWVTAQSLISHGFLTFLFFRLSFLMFYLLMYFVRYIFYAEGNLFLLLLYLITLKIEQKWNYSIFLKTCFYETCDNFSGRLWTVSQLPLCNALFGVSSRKIEESLATNKSLISFLDRKLTSNAYTYPSTIMHPK